MPFGTAEDDTDWGASGVIKQYTTKSRAVKFNGDSDSYRYKIETSGTVPTAPENKPINVSALPIIRIS